MKLDLGDAGDLVQLLPEILGRILQLARRKAFARDGDGGDRNVAEVAVDKGSNDAVGQFDLSIGHLVAKPLPGGSDVRDLVLQVDIDRQGSFARKRPDVLDLGELAYFSFDGNRD